MKFIGSIFVLYLAACLILAVGLPAYVELTGESELIPVLKLIHQSAVGSVAVCAVLALVWLLLGKENSK